MPTASAFFAGVAASIVAGSPSPRKSVVTVTTTEFAFTAPASIPAGTTTFHLVTKGWSCTTLR